MYNKDMSLYVNGLKKKEICLKNILQTGNERNFEVT